MKRSIIGSGTRHRRPLPQSLPSRPSLFCICMLPTMTNLVALLLILMVGNLNNNIDRNVHFVHAFSAISGSSRTMISDLRTRRRQTHYGTTQNYHYLSSHYLLSLSTTPLQNVEEEDNDDGEGEEEATLFTHQQQADVIIDDNDSSLTYSQKIMNSLQLTNNNNNDSLLTSVKEFFTNNKSKFNRESLSKLGMSALLAYGFVSNVSGVIAVSSAWFIFCKRVSRLCV